MRCVSAGGMRCESFRSWAGMALRRVARETHVHQALDKHCQSSNRGPRSIDPLHPSSSTLTSFTQSLPETLHLFRRSREGSRSSMSTSMPMILPKFDTASLISSGRLLGGGYVSVPTFPLAIKRLCRSPKQDGRVTLWRPMHHLLSICILREQGTGISCFL